MSQPDTSAVVTGRLDRETVTADDDHLEIKLWLRLLTCSTLIERDVRQRLDRQFDITLSRFDVMAQLERSGDGLTMGQLSQRMMVTHGNITGLVDRLVKDGLVDRQPVTGNRRAYHVSLTPAGRTEFAQLATAHSEWICTLLNGVDRPEIEKLLDLLGQLKTAIVTELDAGKDTLS